MGSFYMESTQINYRRDETVKTVDQKLQELSETSAIDTDIAPVFKSTNTYAPGDMVYYRNKLYVFNVEHTGAWAAADVTATDVTTELSSLKSGLTNVGNRDKVFLFAQNAVASVLSFTGTAAPRSVLAQIIIVGQGGVTSTINLSTKGSGSIVNLASTQIYPSDNDYGIVTSGEDDGKVNITSGDILGGWGKIYVRSFDHSMDDASVSITYAG